MCLNICSNKDPKISSIKHKAVRADENRVGLQTNGTRAADDAVQKEVEHFSQSYPHGAILHR